MTNTPITSDKLHIDEKFVIEDLETLKVLADPLRLRIIQTMGENPTTVKQISKALDIPPNKLYYHVNMLEEHGLIRVVDTRIVSGIIEKLYLVTARSYRPASDLLSPTVTENESNVTMLVDSIFEETRQSILAAFRAGLISAGEGVQHGDQLLHTNMASMTLNLTEEEAQAFNERLQALFNEVCGVSEKPKTEEPRHPYRLLFTYFPLVQIGGGEDDEPPEGD